MIKHLVERQYSRICLFDKCLLFITVSKKEQELIMIFGNQTLWSYLQPHNSQKEQRLNAVLRFCTHTHACLFIRQLHNATDSLDKTSSDWCLCWHAEEFFYLLPRWADGLCIHPWTVNYRRKGSTGGACAQVMMLISIYFKYNLISTYKKTHKPCSVACMHHITRGDSQGSICPIRTFTGL